MKNFYKTIAILALILGFGIPALAAFIASNQLASSPTTNYILKTDGTSNSWVANVASSSVYIRNGFSTRFNQSVSFNDMASAMDYVLALGYSAPGITLSSSPTSRAFELGVGQTNIVLTATVTKNSNNIALVTFLKGASTISASSTPNPNGGTFAFTDTGGATTTVTYTAKAGDGTSTTTSNGIVFTGVYPYYYGVGAQGLSTTSIQALTKLVKTKSDTTTVTSPSSQVYYFAYPASYGNLTSILDQNGFETISDYTETTRNFVLLDSTTQSYDVYEYNNPTTQTSFSNTYKY